MGLLAGRGGAAEEASVTLEDVHRMAIEAYAREFDARLVHYVERSRDAGIALDSAIAERARLENEAKRLVTVVAKDGLA